MTLFLDDATKTDTSWVGMFHGDFKEILENKKVLELGCGDCTCSAVMAALGAEVYANDISEVPGMIVEKLNQGYDFKKPIKYVFGNCLDIKFEDDFFDIVIGKAFVHHLTHKQENEITELIVKILKPDGIVRYFEPAVNSKLLDELRWHTPVPGRPSKFQKEKFKEWKKNDPHPDRDNSSKRFRQVGEKYFKETEIVPIGAIERFHRIVPRKIDRNFRRLAFRLEKYLPVFFRTLFARSQMIQYKKPK